MALIAGYGGSLSFSGQTAVTCKSVTVNLERASLDVTQIGDFVEKRAPGRIRRSGTMTLYRNDLAVDDQIRAHMNPANLAGATGATLTFSYTDAGSKTYGSYNIQITSASISDDGTGAAVWELTWEQQ
jgi:hypothetical protein